jgi:hypothetical protein
MLLTVFSCKSFRMLLTVILFCIALHCAIVCVCVCVCLGLFNALHCVKYHNRERERERDRDRERKRERESARMQ